MNPMMGQRVWFQFFTVALGASVLLFLAACDSGEPNEVPLEEYEGPIGEAVVRFLVKNVPVINPDVPKVYTVVKGERLKSTSTAFVKRMDDLKLTFISGEVLTMRDPDRTIVDPRSGLAPVTLQITKIKRAGSDAYEVITGWAYKKNFERWLLRVEAEGDAFRVEKRERLEGNYVAP